MPDETKGEVLGFIIAGIAIVAAVVVYVIKNYEAILCFLDAMAAILAGLGATGIALLLLDSGVSSTIIVLCSITTAIIIYIIPNILLGIKSGDIKFSRPQWAIYIACGGETRLSSAGQTKWCLLVIVNKVHYCPLLRRPRAGGYPCLTFCPESS